MRCSKTFELLSRKLDRDLGFRERETLRAHLESCPACRELQAKLESDSLDLKRVFTFSKPDLRQFVSRTMAFITEMEEPHSPDLVTAERSARRVRRVWVWAQAVGLAASIAMIAYLLFDKGTLTNRISELTVQLETAESEDTAASQATPVPPAAEPSAASESERMTVISDEEGIAALDARETEVDADATDSVTPVGELESFVNLPPDEEAKNLVTRLLAAIEEADSEEIDRLSDVFAALRLQTETAARLLMASYREETDAVKQEQILDVLGSLSSEELTPKFYLDELKLENDTALRRALAKQAARAFAGDEYPDVATRDRLKEMLRNRDEDWEVRAHAAEALWSDSLASLDDTLIREIEAVLVDTTDSDRLREGLAFVIAKNFPDMDHVMHGDVSGIVAEFMGSESDYSMKQRLLEGLQSAVNPGGALEALDRMTFGIEEPSLKSLRRRAREVLAEDRDKTAVRKK